MFVSRAVPNVTFLHSKLLMGVLSEASNVCHHIKIPNLNKVIELIK